MRYNEANLNDVNDIRVVTDDEEKLDGDSEYDDDEDPIHTHLNVCTKDPRYVRKSDNDNRGLGRRSFRGCGRVRYRSSKQIVSTCAQDVIGFIQG